jgi:hypothetical protein
MVRHAGINDTVRNSVGTDTRGAADFDALGLPLFARDLVKFKSRVWRIASKLATTR